MVPGKGNGLANGYNTLQFTNQVYIIQVLIFKPAASMGLNKNFIEKYF
jgi:hypothetical protein